VELAERLYARPAVVAVDALRCAEVAARCEGWSDASLAAREQPLVRSAVPRRRASKLLNTTAF